MNGEIVENKVLVFNQRIIAIETSNDFEDMYGDLDIEIVDAKGNYVSPGFIDIHIHGTGGHDVMDATPEALETIGQIISRSGVTAFLPTTMTQSKEQILQAFSSVKQHMKNQKQTPIRGARILGIHMEGPFISSEYKGAQDASYIVNPDFKLVEEYLNQIKVITIAPETLGGIEFIRRITQESSTICSMGHTNATYEEAMEGIHAGIKSATHLFNAMTPLHHRDPGAVGAVLNSDVYFELIADTIHSHPAMFSLMADIKGANRMILVTDAMRATCMKCGQYDLGGQTVTVTETSARLPDGTLAGSVLQMNQAIKNVVEHTKYNLATVVGMASENPARLIGCFEERGSIAVEKYADVILFDKTYTILSTYVEGKLQFEKESKDENNKS